MTPEEHDRRQLARLFEDANEPENVSPNDIGFRVQMEILRALLRIEDKLGHCATVTPEQGRALMEELRKVVGA